MKKRWIYPPPVDSETITSLSHSINVNRSLAAILVQRGVNNFDQAKTFFRPSLNDLHDPFLMADMAKAVERINDASFKKEKILVYGDYDVDGTTSVALTYGFLKNHGHTDIAYYIPDRYEEGYGISEKGIRRASEQNFNLVIALDCGIKAYKNAKLAKALGLDLIICDHHLPAEQLPDAYCILDPKRKDCNYPFDGLSGCGVGFKLLQAFCQQNAIAQNELYEYLDLVAVSIASDLVPITNENRVLAYFGLKKLGEKPSIGLAALKEISGLKSKEVDIQDVVFGIGPRINAAGRIGHAKSAVQLLVVDNAIEAKALAGQINTENTKRKDFDKEITQEALVSIGGQIDPSKRSTVLYNKDWHKGVIGIVASRCIENYYRPTIILTESNGKATGSARSVEGFDIYEAIASCSDLLEQYGGHQFAAGLTMELKDIQPFQEKFEQTVRSTISEDSLYPKITTDLELPLEAINFRFYKVLEQIGPFGPGNSEPLFSSSGLVIVGEPRIMKEVHMKFHVRQKNRKESYEVVAFNLASYKDQLTKADHFSLAYHIQHTTYMGEKSLQLNVKDIHFE